MIGKGIIQGHVLLTSAKTVVAYPNTSMLQGVKKKIRV